MTSLRWAAGLLVIYISGAEILYSRRMMLRQKERDRAANRPAAPFPAEDFIARVYFVAGVFVAGLFVGAVALHGC